MAEEATATVEETKAPPVEEPNEFSNLDDAIEPVSEEAFTDPKVEPEGKDTKQPADKPADASDETVGDEDAKATEPSVVEDPWDNVGANVLLDTARKVFNLTEDQARGYGSPEALAAVLRRDIDTYQPEQGAVEQEVSPEDQPFKVDLDPADYDEKVIGAIKGLNDHFEKKFARQEAWQAQDREQYQRVADSATAAQVHRTRQEFDEWTKTLGDQWDGHYGNASIADVKTGSSEAKNVKALVLRAGAISASYAANGEPISDTESLHLAHYLLNREVMDKENKSSARKDVLKNIKAGPNTISHKPTHRAEPSDETTNQKAAREYDSARAAFVGDEGNSETDAEELGRILVE